MKPSTWLCRIGVASLFVFANSTQAADAVSTVRLYALDCGRIAFKDLSFFSDTGDYDGKSGSIVDPCFLIRHSKGTLLWDTGLGDELAKQKGGVDNNGVRLNVDATLICEQPRIGPHRAEMERNLSEVLSARVSVKASSNEGMGFIGRGEGIACVVVAALESE